MSEATCWKQELLAKEVYHEMKNAALYARVSTAEQRDHGLSVDSQIDALQTYCREHGYHIYGLYNDAGISARKTYKKRPALLRMIADCRAKKIDIVLFTKLDRFFRSVPDYYACVEQMNGVPWRAIWEDYETETSAGVFKVNIMLSVAQSEADRTSERIKAVNNFRRARGDYVGQVPVGYKREGRTLVIDEEKRAGVQALFDGYLAYKPIEECVADARAKGVSFHRRTANDVLKRATYYGDAYGAVVPAYITKSQHDAIIARMSENIRRPVRTGTVFLFQGICRCGYCGCKMSSSSRRRHSNRRGDYIQIIYQCRKAVNDFVNVPCNGCGINEEYVEESLLQQIEPEMNEYNARVKATVVNTDIEEILAARKSLQGKLTRLADLYEDGMIDRAEYRQKRDAIREDLSRLPEPEQAHEVSLPPDWKTMYDQLTKENKREFWHSAIKEVKIYRGHKIAITF